MDLWYFVRVVPMSTSQNMRHTPFRVAFAAWLALALGFFFDLALSPVGYECQRMVDERVQ